MLQREFLYWCSIPHNITTEHIELTKIHDLEHPTITDFHNFAILHMSTESKVPGQHAGRSSWMDAVYSICPSWYHLPTIQQSVCQQEN
jgi:hypothetical protein